MLAQSSQQQSISGQRVAAVPRKLTTVGGYSVVTDGMPEKQSGETSAGGVVPELAEDGQAEASAILLALIGTLAEVTQDIADRRFIVADERLKASLMKLVNARDLAQHLALHQQVPFKCPRCQAADTHDHEGKCFCGACVSATFGQPKV